jgi:hypothetical protein
MPVSNTDPQGVYSDQGLRTQYGIILPPGARVAGYVRSLGIQSGDDAFLASNLSTTLAAGLAKVRANLGDYVIVLPGHVESVVDGTTFSNALIAGTKIIGVGKGSNTPTFNWTASASQWLVNKPDVVIAGLRMNLTAAAASPTLCLSVTAADFGFYYNDVITANGSGTALGVMTLGAGADRADVSNNVFRCLANNGVQGILVNAAIDNARICDNEIICAATSAAGFIAVTGAATAIKILRNVISNTVAGSVAGISFSNVAATGQCAYNSITVLSTGVFSAGVTGITVGGTNNLVGFFQNFAVNDPNKSGLLVPVVDT